jgi:hypothetical protein
MAPNVTSTTQGSGDVGRETAQPPHEGVANSYITQTGAPPFKFSLTQQLQVSVSGEQGECIARSEHAAADPQYLLRYRAADGRAVEAWWTERALSAVADDSAQDLIEGWHVLATRLRASVQPAATAELPRHPSRSAPKCEQCTYFIPGMVDKCDHPLQPVSYLTGKPKMDCIDVRSDLDEPALKYGMVPCGSVARLFKARQAA